MRRYIISLQLNKLKISSTQELIEWFFFHQLIRRQSTFNFDKRNIRKMMHSQQFLFRLLVNNHKSINWNLTVYRWLFCWQHRNTALMRLQCKYGHVIHIHVATSKSTSSVHLTFLYFENLENILINFSFAVYIIERNPCGIMRMKQQEEEKK